MYGRVSSKNLKKLPYIFTLVLHGQAYAGQTKQHTIACTLISNAASGSSLHRPIPPVENCSRAEQNSVYAEVRAR